MRNLDWNVIRPRHREEQADNSRLRNLSDDSAMRLKYEWHHAPYQSDEIEARASKNDDTLKPSRCSIVYIRSFTTKARMSLDFAYLIQGRDELARFFFGMFGALMVCRRLRTAAKPTDTTPLSIVH
jgi:hypothetical protein